MPLCLMNSCETNRGLRANWNNKVYTNIKVYVWTQGAYDVLFYASLDLYS